MISQWSYSVTNINKITSARVCDWPHRALPQFRLKWSLSLQVSPIIFTVKQIFKNILTHIWQRYHMHATYSFMSRAPLHVSTWAQGHIARLSKAHVAVGHILWNTGKFGSVEPHQTKSRSQIKSELLLSQLTLIPGLLRCSGGSARFTIVWIASGKLSGKLSGLPQRVWQTYLATNLAKRAIAPR